MKYLNDPAGQTCHIVFNASQRFFSMLLLVGIDSTSSGVLRHAHIRSAGAPHASGHHIYRLSVELCFASFIVVDQVKMSLPFI